MIRSIQAVFDTALDGIILMDSAGTVRVFNRACERMFGYGADEVVGANVKILMPPIYGDHHDQYLENHRRTGERKIIGTRRTLLGRRKSGEIFPMDLSVGEAPSDAEADYVAMLRDVSERVHAEEQRERLIEQLAKSNGEMTHFVRAASHDLRQPLRMITAFGSRLAKDFSDRLDARGLEYLTLVTSAGEQMTRLLDDLVDFARLSDEVERNSRFDANRVVDLTIDSLSTAIKRSDAVVEHGPLPWITANPIRFERLMINLIGNAIKYVAEGVRPHVNVDATAEGAFWRFSVSDNGIGIDPRHFARVFEPFKRLHTQAHYEGTGLGLAICRKIVEGFGGQISLRSSEGQGSTFSFTIPADAETHGSNKHDHQQA